MWTFSVDNMRNTYLKTVREEWRDSRIFFGKIKVMAKAMGTSPEEEYADGLHELAKTLKGVMGILATNDEPQVVKSYFEGFIKSDFARAGTRATETVVVPEGPLYSRAGMIPAKDDSLVSHTMEPQLRQLGLPTVLKNGVIHVLEPYTVCRDGQIMDSRQTHLLKHFGITMSEFRVKLKAYYDKESNQVSKLTSGDDDDDDDVEEDEDAQLDETE